MDINDSFPSNFLKARDLKGHSVDVTISDVSIEDIGDGEKPVLHMTGKDRGIVLNKTNASVIQDAYGAETSGWVGKPITVYPDKTTFKGELVDCIRVRVPADAPDADAEVPF